VEKKQNTTTLTWTYAENTGLKSEKKEMLQYQLHNAQYVKRLSTQNLINVTIVTENMAF